MFAMTSKHDAQLYRGTLVKSQRPRSPAVHVAFVANSATDQTQKGGLAKSSKTAR